MSWPEPEEPVKGKTLLWNVGQINGLTWPPQLPEGRRCPVDRQHTQNGFEVTRHHKVFPDANFGDSKLRKGTPGLKENF
jgi:hypothetical protein